jgi:hypothetical protein
MARICGKFEIIVLKTVEPKPKPAGLTGLMVDRFKPVNKPNRSTGL